MARRPARCYRYCKNKVSPLFQICTLCLLWAKYIARSTSLTRTTSAGIRDPYCVLTESQSFYSHIPSLDSIVVSLTPKFESSIWGASVPTSTNSLSASTWSPTNTSSFLLKLSKQPVSAPISMSFSTPLLLSSTPADPDELVLQISSQNCR